MTVALTPCKWSLVLFVLLLLLRVQHSQQQHLRGRLLSDTEHEPKHLHSSVRFTQWLQAQTSSSSSTEALGQGHAISAARDNSILVGALHSPGAAYLYQATVFDNSWTNAAFTGEVPTQEEALLLTSAQAGLCGGLYCAADESASALQSSGNFTNMLGTKVWTQLARLVPDTTSSSTATAADFGHAVAALTGTAVVAAPAADCVYVFSSHNGASSGTWSQQAKLQPTYVSAMLDPGFGSSISVSAGSSSSGDSDTDLDTPFIAVGSPHASNEGRLEPSEGAVYTFARSHSSLTSWSQQAQLIASDTSIGNLFGAAVSVTDEVVAVGAPGRNSNSGAVYVFARSSSNNYNHAWSQQAILLHTSSSLNSAGDYFGYSLAVSNGKESMRYMVASSPRSRAAVYMHSAASAYASSEQWSLEAKLEPEAVSDGSVDVSDSSGYGDSLVMWDYNNEYNNRGLAVGSPASDTVHLYSYDTSSTSVNFWWTRETVLTVPRAVDGPFFGMSLAVLDTGVELAVSTYGNNADTGGLLLYQDVHEFDRRMVRTEDAHSELDIVDILYALAGYLGVALLSVCGLRRERKSLYKKAEAVSETNVNTNKKSPIIPLVPLLSYVDEEPDGYSNPNRARVAEPVIDGEKSSTPPGEGSPSSGRSSPIVTTTRENSFSSKQPSSRFGMPSRENSFGNTPVSPLSRENSFPAVGSSPIVFFSPRSNSNVSRGNSFQSQTPGGGQNSPRSISREGSFDGSLRNSDEGLAPPLGSIARAGSAGSWHGSWQGQAQQPNMPDGITTVITRKAMRNLANKNILKFYFSDYLLDFSLTSLCSACEVLFVIFCWGHGGMAVSIGLILSWVCFAFLPWLLIYIDLSYPQRLPLSLSTRASIYHLKAPFRLYRGMYLLMLGFSIGLVRYLPWRQTFFSLHNNGYPTKGMWRMAVYFEYLHLQTLAIGSAVISFSSVAPLELIGTEVNTWPILSGLTFVVALVRLLVLFFSVLLPVWCNTSRANSKVPAMSPPEMASNSTFTGPVQIGQDGSGSDTDEDNSGNADNNPHQHPNIVKLAKASGMGGSDNSMSSRMSKNTHRRRKSKQKKRRGSHDTFEEIVLMEPLTSLHKPGETGEHDSENRDSNDMELPLELDPFLTARTEVLDAGSRILSAELSPGKLTANTDTIFQDNWRDRAGPAALSVKKSTTMQVPAGTFLLPGHLSNVRGFESPRSPRDDISEDGTLQSFRDDITVTTADKRAIAKQMQRSNSDATIASQFTITPFTPIVTAPKQDRPMIPLLDFSKLPERPNSAERLRLGRGGSNSPQKESSASIARAMRESQKDQKNSRRAGGGGGGDSPRSTIGASDTPRTPQRSDGAAMPVLGLSAANSSNGRPGSGTSSNGGKGTGSEQHIALQSQASQLSLGVTSVHSAAYSTDGNNSVPSTAAQEHSRAGPFIPPLDLGPALSLPVIHRLEPLVVNTRPTSASSVATTTSSGGSSGYDITARDGDRHHHHSREVTRGAQTGSGEGGGEGAHICDTDKDVGVSEAQREMAMRMEARRRLSKMSLDSNEYEGSKGVEEETDAHHEHKHKHKHKHRGEETGGKRHSASRQRPAKPPRMASGPDLQNSESARAAVAGTASTPDAGTIVIGTEGDEGGSVHSHSSGGSSGYLRTARRRFDSDHSDAAIAGSGGSDGSDHGGAQSKHYTLAGVDSEDLSSGDSYSSRSDSDSGSDSDSDSSDSNKNIRIRQVTSPA